MKTIAIRLTDVEAAMLMEVQKGNKDYRDINALLIGEIKREYERLLKSREKR